MATKKIKILLDPGHDKAKYNQSPVVPEYWEGARMWRLSQLLRLALVARGFDVGVTKSQCDQALSVTQRGAMARGYDALISLHSNACGTASVDRPVGIYFVDDDCGPIDDESKDLAVLLSKAVADTMGTSQPQQYSRLSKNDRDHDGQKNDDHYGVLFAAHQAGVPAIILEHSFHTNRAAALWLMSDDNLRKLAEAEADALAEYYGVTAPGSLPATNKEEGTPVKMVTVKRGSKHAHVRVLQALLRGLGYTDANGDALAVDGSYGPATEQAVRKYQGKNKDADGKPLAVDGKCGPKTWGSILEQ